VLAGASDPSIKGVEVKMLKAKNANAEDLLWADVMALGTPENFGYMSGMTKDFFDRTFYEVEGKLSPLPYALFICAGNDGSGAIRSIERIANGYPFQKIQDPIICKGDQSTARAQCKELGQMMAVGVEMGIF
jgi:multimeric flavodoxin WrbA